MRRRGTWAVLWMFSCLSCGCYSATSEEAREHSTAAAAGSTASVAGSRAVDACPARPLSEVDFCVLVGSLPGGTFSPLPTCPREAYDAGNLSCHASWKMSSCGGRIVTVPDEPPPVLALVPGYTEYHYDADNMLVGVLRHFPKGTGCAGNPRFGKTCPTEEPVFPPCAIPAGSPVQR